MNEIDTTYDVDEIYEPDYKNEKAKITMLIVIDRKDDIAIRKQVLIATNLLLDARGYINSCNKTQQQFAISDHKTDYSNNELHDIVIKLIVKSDKDEVLWFNR